MCGFGAIIFYLLFYLKTGDCAQEGVLWDIERKSGIPSKEIRCVSEIMFDLRKMNATGERINWYSEKV